MLTHPTRCGNRVRGDDADGYGLSRRPIAATMAPHRTDEMKIAIVRPHELFARQSSIIDVSCRYETTYTGSPPDRGARSNPPSTRPLEVGRPHGRRGSAVPAVAGRGRARRPPSAGSLRVQFRPESPAGCGGRAQHARTRRSDAEPGMNSRRSRTPGFRPERVGVRFRGVFPHRVACVKPRFAFEP